MIRLKRHGYDGFVYVQKNKITHVVELIGVIHVYVVGRDDALRVEGAVMEILAQIMTD